MLVPFPPFCCSSNRPTFIIYWIYCDFMKYYPLAILILTLSLLYPG